MVDKQQIMEDNHGEQITEDQKTAGEGKGGGEPRGTGDAGPGGLQFIKKANLLRAYNGTGKTIKRLDTGTGL